MPRKLTSKHFIGAASALALASLSIGVALADRATTGSSSVSTTTAVPAPSMPACSGHARIEVFANHTGISVNGSRFPTTGEQVRLVATGLGSGTPAGFTDSTTVTPRRTPMSVHPCLLGVYCNAGTFYEANMSQPHDPCGGGAGFMRVRVDATMRGPHGECEAAQATVSNRCLAPPR